jgi:methyl-accepting chemotaxis protein
MRHAKWIFLLTAVISLTACETVVYDALEKVGYHKRDILIDRIDAAQASQTEGQEQFKSALEQFKSVINFDGGDLEVTYDQLNDEYEASVDAADEIHDRIDSVENVADALFDEWQEELEQYSNASLRRDSERQLKDTRRRYSKVLGAMRRAEKAIDPVLASLKDNTLYLKHNLNARAIASLKNELGTVDNDVNALLTAMQQAINESNAFIDELRGG